MRINFAIFVTVLVAVTALLINIWPREPEDNGEHKTAKHVRTQTGAVLKKDFKVAGADAILAQDDFTGKTVAEALGLILRNPDEEVREQQFRTLLAKMTPNDAPGIQKLFTDANKLGRWYIPEYHAFMAQWGKSDGPAAAAWALKNYKQYESPLVQRIMGGWVRSNPQQAVDWLNDTDMPEWMHNSAMEGLVKGLAADNIKMASDLALENLDAPAASSMTAAILDSYIYRDNGLSSAETWLKSIETESPVLQASLFSQLMDRTLRSGDLEAGLSLITRNAMEKWCNPTAVRRVVQGYADAGTVEKLIPWVNSLPEGSTKKVASQFVQNVAPLLPLLPPPVKP